ncbi:hypothetical protein OIO90_000838 [Microbotryomycetes sp. JL221]|nr:hypothetical protein OIO90_000838 [Microbotryomycetes sp. JL221]
MNAAGPSSVPLQRQGHQTSFTLTRPTTVNGEERDEDQDCYLSRAGPSSNMMQHRTADNLHAKPFVPFNMADVAAAALSRRQREHDQRSESWAERDETTHCPDSPASSSRSQSPFGSAPGSPITQPSSCALTPSSSSEGYALPKPVAARPEGEARQVRTTAVVSAQSTCDLPTSNEEWCSSDFSLKLTFTHSNHAQTSNLSLNGPEQEDASAPPAFFPSSRIAFAPKVRIANPAGLPYTSLGGMHLGITGMCEVLNPDGSTRTKRMIADFCIDLTSGLALWKRDAERARQKNGHARQVPGQERLPAGTYLLPLKMKIPDCDRLPPSFASRQFRIHYTMSVAVFSATRGVSGLPRRLKVFSLPFHILPATLPCPPPQLPSLSYEHKKGMLASLVHSLPFSGGKLETGYHVVMPSMPTSHFSPGSHSSVPVSLRIVDRPLEPTDLYIRLAIVRRIYVRESNSKSLASAVETEWGLSPGETLASVGCPEDAAVDPWCKEEEEIVSRWGWIPYASRPGSNPFEQSEVVIKDIALPLSGADGSGWQHGYTSMLDLVPTTVPRQSHGECSWFSPAFRHRAPVENEYAKHLHVSTRFFLSIEIGFATPQLGDVLQRLGSQSPDMEIPMPNTFTSPASPQVSMVSGLSLSNPFHVPSSSASRNAVSSGTPASPQAFPGTMRELMIPLTIGSVAEPTTNRLATSLHQSIAAATTSGLSSDEMSEDEQEQTSANERQATRRRAERDARQDRGEAPSSNRGDVYLNDGDDGASERPWMCAPPAYEDALKTVPYVW